MQGFILFTAIFAGTVIAIIYLLKSKEPVTTIVQQPIQYPISTDKVTETATQVSLPKPTKAYNKQVSVSNQITDLYHQRDGLPWMRFVLYNAGPSPVYVGVNDWKWPEAPVAVGQTISYDFGEVGAINRVFLKCNDGEQTTVNLNVIE